MITDAQQQAGNVLRMRALRLVKPFPIARRTIVASAIFMMLLLTQSAPDVHATLHLVTIFVHDEPGKPLAGSKVTLDQRELSFNPIQWFDTDSRGFVVKNVESGTYTTWAEAAVGGKQCESKRTLVVIDHNRAIDIEVKTGATATALWLHSSTTEIQVNMETSLHIFLGPITTRVIALTVTGCGIDAQRTTTESPTTFHVKPTSTGSITVNAERAGWTSSLLITVSGSAPGSGFAAFGISKLLWRWTPIAARFLGLVAFALLTAAYSLVKNRLEGKAR